MKISRKLAEAVRSGSNPKCPQVTAAISAFRIDPEHIV